MALGPAGSDLSSILSMLPGKGGTPTNFKDLAIQKLGLDPLVGTAMGIVGNLLGNAQKKSAATNPFGQTTNPMTGQTSHPTGGMSSSSMTTNPQNSPLSGGGMGTMGSRYQSPIRNTVQKPGQQFRSGYGTRPYEKQLGQGSGGIGLKGLFKIRQSMGGGGLF
jgi:hypothetical protein